MKKLFYDIERRLLINNPVVWISSIHWIMGFCFLIMVIEVAIGFMAKPAASLTVFYALALMILVVFLFLWISFQYKNYDKIFTISQTFKIYLYNILAYILICMCILLLMVIMHFRFKALTTPEEFSKDLLSVRVSNLRMSDINFIKSNPQLFTSQGFKGSNSDSNSIDLRTEYESRLRLEENPFVKNDLSYSYGILMALRKMKGYESLDTVMTEEEKKRSQSKNRILFPNFHTIDEDPIFFKYISGLSRIQLDSLRTHSMTVISKFGLEPARLDTSDAGLRTQHFTLSTQFARLLDNSRISKSQIDFTIILLMAICSITFNFILTKNTLCLFAPFVYLSLLLLAYTLFGVLVKPARNLEPLTFVLPNVFLLMLFRIVLLWKHNIYNKNVLFFIGQLQNFSALAFFIILLSYTSKSDILSNNWKILLFVLSIAGFLITHYFFVRKMHHTLIQEV